MIRLLFLACCVAGAVPAGAANAESGDVRREVLEAVVRVLKGEAPVASVARHFRRDAVFVGDQRYPWNLADFRNLLVRSRCALPNVSYLPERELLGGLDRASRANVEATGQPRGPGIGTICEGGFWAFSFSFHGRKVSEVRLSHIVATPPTPPPPRSSPSVRNR